MESRDQLGGVSYTRAGAGYTEGGGGSGGGGSFGVKMAWSTQSHGWHLLGRLQSGR